MYSMTELSSYSKYLDFSWSEYLLVMFSSTLKILDNSIVEFYIMTNRNQSDSSRFFQTIMAGLMTSSIGRAAIE